MYGEDVRHSYILERGGCSCENRFNGYIKIDSKCWNLNERDKCILEKLNLPIVPIKSKRSKVIVWSRHARGGFKLNINGGSYCNSGIRVEVVLFVMMKEIVLPVLLFIMDMQQILLLNSELFGIG